MRGHFTLFTAQPFFHNTGDNPAYFVVTIIRLVTNLFLLSAFRIQDLQNNDFPTT